MVIAVRVSTARFAPSIIDPHLTDGPWSIRFVGINVKLRWE